MAAIQIFGSLGLLLQLMVVARIAGIEDAGVYSLAMGVAVPLSICIGLGMRELVQLAQVADSELRGLLTFRLLTVLPVALACIALAAVVAPPIAAVALLTAAKAIDQIGEFYVGLGLRRGRPQAAFGPTALNPLVTAGTMGAQLALGQSLSAALLGSVLVSLLFSFAFPALSRRLRPGQIRRTVAIGFLRMGSPLALSAFVISFRTYLPRFVVGLMIGIDAVAVFSAATSFLQAPLVVTTSMARTSITPLSTSVKQGNRVLGSRLFRRLALTLTLVGGLSALGWLVLGDWLSRSLYGDEFALSAALVWAIAVVFVVNPLQVTVRVGLVASNYMGSQLWATVTSMVALLVMAAPLIWVFGIAGAAIAIAISTLVYIAFALRRLSREDR